MASAAGLGLTLYHPAPFVHTHSRVPGAQALIPEKGAVSHAIPLPGLKARGLYLSSRVLQAIRQPGLVGAGQGSARCVRTAADWWRPCGGKPLLEKSVQNYS